MIDAAIVVLFKPADNYFEAICSYADAVKMLYIVDNSPEPSGLLQKLRNLKQAKILASGKNIGIASAYNLALDQAVKDGYHWLVTMDQDSSFDVVQLKRFIDHFEEHKREEVGVYVPLHHPKFVSSLLPQSKESVMSSASIVNIEAAAKIGGFDEKLFIDEVDHDFCLRLKSAGFIILEDQGTYVHHRLGERNPITNRVDYPPERLYYMVRNFLYVAKRQKKSYPLFFRERSVYLMKFLFRQVVYGRDKRERIKMIILGIRDYYRQRMGYRYG